MAETLLDVSGLPKPQAYQRIQEQLEAILEGIDDPISVMATIAAVLHQSLSPLWAGFYRLVRPELLRVGPYQGTLGCLEILVGRGVCGTAAAERRTVIVSDVDAFAGHISCDARSRSEIVVPVFDAAGALTAVLDLDSERPGAFDADDARGLEQIVRLLAGCS